MCAKGYPAVKLLVDNLFGCDGIVRVDGDDVIRGIELFPKSGRSGDCGGEGEEEDEVKTMQLGSELHVHGSVELLGTEGRVRELYPRLLFGVRHL